MADHMRPTGTIDPCVLPGSRRDAHAFGVRLPGDLVTDAGARHPRRHPARPRARHVDGHRGQEMMTSTTAPKPVDPEAMVRRELVAALPHLRRLPERIDRILTLAGRGDLRLRTSSTRTSTHRPHPRQPGAPRRGRRRVPVRLGAPAHLVRSGTDLATSSGLFEIFGFGGLFAGTVLLLRVVAAVARDGTT